MRGFGTALTWLLVLGGTAAAVAGLVMLLGSRVATSFGGAPELAGQIDSFARARYPEVTAEIYAVADGLTYTVLSGVAAVGEALADVPRGLGGSPEGAPRAVAATPQPTPSPRPTATPAPADVVVGNTGGSGVYVRRAPVEGATIKAWPDGTRLTVVGEDRQAGGGTWRNVRDPGGDVGWVPAQYLVEGVR